VATALVWNYEGGGCEIEVFNIGKKTFERFLPVFDKAPEKGVSGYTGEMVISEGLKLTVHFETGLETEFVNPVDVEVQRRLDEKFVESFPKEDVNHD